MVFFEFSIKHLSSEFEDIPKLTDEENEAMKVLKAEMDELRQELQVEKNVNNEAGLEIDDQQFSKITL